MEILIVPLGHGFFSIENGVEYEKFVHVPSSTFSNPISSDVLQYMQEVLINHSMIFVTQNIS